ncbi:MAG: prepilin-type N-terminal cleavage/methylation domain-containing protein [Patescibacteria group bacterium]
MSGFTLIELMVTIGIFSVITSVVLTNYRGFIVNANFSNASESVVIALREAQVYGVGTKKSAVVCGTSNFTCAFGVHIDTTDRNSFTVFADVNDNKIYDAPGEKVETVNFPLGTSIQSLSCAPIVCSARLDVTFKRPNPDAFIADTALQGVSYDSATIGLTNGIRNSTITISTAGQMSLQ